MNKQLAAVLASALLAVLSIPSTAMSIFNPTTVYVIDQSATSWADSAGMGFGNSRGDGDGGITLDKVVVTGKRIINLEVVNVSAVTFTGQNNAFDPAPLQQFRFDSRDQGIEITKDKVPSPEDRQKCIANCAGVQVAQNAICDSRAATIQEVAVIGAGGARLGRFIPKLDKHIPREAPSEILDKGTKAAIAYAFVCKGEAAGEYTKCVNGTCAT